MKCYHGSMIGRFFGTTTKKIVLWLCFNEYYFKLGTLRFDFSRTVNVTGAVDIMTVMRIGTYSIQ